MNDLLQEPKTADQLDSLAGTVTAFPTWAELTAACNGGYAPTLRVSPRKRKNRFEKATEALALALTERGYKVFDGRRIIGG